MNLPKKSGSVGWSTRPTGRRHRSAVAVLIPVLLTQFGCAGSGTGNFVRMSTRELFPDAREETVSPSREGGIHWYKLVT